MPNKKKTSRSVKEDDHMLNATAIANRLPLSPASSQSILRPVKNKTKTAKDLFARALNSQQLLR